MNERIRELAEQIVGPSRLHGGEFALMGNNQVEKFAELIVQECGRVADQWVNDEDNGTNLVSDKLKQHFGVKG